MQYINVVNGTQHVNVHKELGLHILKKTNLRACLSFLPSYIPRLVSFSLDLRSSNLIYKTLVCFISSVLPVVMANNHTL